MKYIVFSIFLLTLISGAQAQKVMVKGHITPLPFLIMPLDLGGNIEYVLSRKRSVELSGSYHHRPATFLKDGAGESDGLRIIAAYRNYFKPGNWGASKFYVSPYLSYAYTDAYPAYLFEASIPYIGEAHFASGGMTLGYQTIAHSRLLFDFFLGAEVGYRKRRIEYDMQPATQNWRSFVNLRLGIAIGFALGKKLE